MWIKVDRFCRKSIILTALNQTTTVLSLPIKSRFNPKMTSILKTVGSAITGKFLDKPKYEQKSNPIEGIEERHYVASKWVSTTIEGMSHEDARSVGFQRLFKYITGNNENNQKVDMTAPVATKIVPGAGPNCENSFTVSFYIPTELQDNPPEPSASDVFIEEWPPMDVYVTTFGGFAKENDWMSEAKSLTEKINDSRKIREDMWFTAGYNSPFQLVGRTNEVWLVKNSGK